jgi:hypothetical protein
MKTLLEKEVLWKTATVFFCILCLLALRVEAMESVLKQTPDAQEARLWRNLAWNAAIYIMNGSSRRLAGARQSADSATEVPADCTSGVVRKTTWGKIKAKYFVLANRPRGGKGEHR